MVSGACAEMIQVPASSFAAVDRAVDELIVLQKQSSALEARAKILRATVKDALVRGDLRSFQSASGHRATLSEVTRTDADRALAAELLDSDTYGQIFTPSTSLVLRVK